MLSVILAHADGEKSTADLIAEPLRNAGYKVLYEGTMLVGESIVEEVSKALSAGSPVVLCGTINAVGTGWAHRVVNAAIKYRNRKIFPLRIDRQAYIELLSLDLEIAEYWQDPNKAIDDLLKALRKHYPLKAETAHSTADSLERRYINLALQTYDIVDLANLPVTDREIATRQLMLRSLYVALRATVESQPQPDSLEDITRGSSAKSREASSLENSTDESKRYSIGELLSRSHQLVILGDPGAGKSTLLRWMATAYLLKLKSDPSWRDLPDVAALPDKDWLPILVRCRDLEETRATASLEQILDHHLRNLGIIRAEVKQLNELLLKRLSEGRALLLLDGLDEISRPAARARFCRQIEQTHVAYSGAPIIATSRIVGYREMALRIGRGFEHATVLDLTDADKDEFITKWCMLTEPTVKREQAKSELINDIHSTDRIERLTGNPMLLTTMALVKKKVGKLPSKRADLYREAVDVLLNWRSDIDELLDPYEAKPQLEYIAYAMCVAGVQQLRTDEIVELLRRMRFEFPSIRPVRRHDPLEFLQLLERRTGILTEIGRVLYRGSLVPAYEFRHLTFQEYLASLALVTGRFPARDKKLSLADRVSPLAAQTTEIPQNIQSLRGDFEDLDVSENWREALRLCVTECPDDDVDSVLMAIANVRDEEDSVVTARPRIRLAVSCLADEPNVSEEVAIELIDRFVAILKKGDEVAPFGITGKVIRDVGVSLWGPLLRQRLILAWMSRQESSDLLPLCFFTAASTFIGSIGDLPSWIAERITATTDAEPRDRVEFALEVSEAAYRTYSSDAERFSVSRSLIAFLFKMLKKHGREAEAAAMAIRDLVTEEYGPAPVWKLSKAQNAYLASRLMDSEISELTFRILVKVLKGDYSDNHDFARLLANHLQEPPMDPSYFRCYTRLFPGYIDPMIALLRDGPKDTRFIAAETLGRLGDTAAVGTLITMLSDKDRDIVDAAASSLGRLGDQRAVVPLTKLKETLGISAPSPVVAALVSLGDSTELKEFQKIMAGKSKGERVEALWQLASLEQNPDDRVMLSRDSDGIAPGIDPKEVIKKDMVKEFAKRFHKTQREVRIRYEYLQGKYLLSLEWQ